MKHDDLIAKHRPTAELAARRFGNKHKLPDHDDLTGVALLCLVKSAYAYHPKTKESDFSGFLVQRINWRLTDWLRRQSGRGLQVKLVSLNMVLLNGNRLERQLSDPRPTIEQLLVESSDMDRLRKILGGSWARQNFSLKESAVMRLLLSGLWQREVGKQLHLSESRVCQIYGTAREKIKAHLANS